MKNEDYTDSHQPYKVDDLDLAQFDEDFSQAEIDEREFEPIPDGKYQVIIEKVELCHARTSGNPMLKWTLRILGPKYEGRLLWRNNVMATPENLKWLKTDLHVCGLDLDKLSELPANLHKIIDVKIEVTKRTRGENENVYINRRSKLNDGEDAYNAASSDALAQF
jgi:hypothetical protein